MDVRTVRRYIAHLQDVGIPIEATIGRYGGYRLRPGFKLPPLMLTEEEAAAIMLGLLGTSWLEIGQSSAAVEGALAKVSRVLPPQARDRLNSLGAHLWFAPVGQRDRPDAALLIGLSQAIGQQQCVALDYRALGDELTHRTVEPYGVVGWQGHWYLVGYCRLRRDHRTFRIDRIQRARTQEERFERPADFDCQEFILRRYGASAGSAQIAVEFQAPLAAVERRIPASYGQLSATPDGGTLLQTRYDDLDDMARYLLGVNLPFVVREPPELRDALRCLGERILSIASATPAAGDAASA
jgi:predicted DNA-binding transcriptional regulator YafY